MRTIDERIFGILCNLVDLVYEDIVNGAANDYEVAGVLEKDPYWGDCRTELLLALEVEFELEISDQEFEELRTVGDIKSFVKTKLNFQPERKLEELVL